MLTPEQFREQIDAYLSRKPDMTATRFGIAVVRDPNFVTDIRNGRVPSLKIAGRVLEFIAANPPSTIPASTSDRSAA